MKALLLLLLVVVLCASSIECGRILISAPFGSKSHQNTYVPLIKALAARGHHITLITNYGVKDLRPLSNVTQIEMDELKIDPAMFGDVFQKAIGKGGGVLAGLSNAVNIFNMMGQMQQSASTGADEDFSFRYGDGVAVLQPDRLPAGLVLQRHTGNVQSGWSLSGYCSRPGRL